MSEQTRFTDLTEIDVSPWRELLVTKLLLEYLRAEIAEATKMVPFHLEHGNVDAARLATTYLRSCEGLLHTIEDERSDRTPAPDEPFLDPAALLPKGLTDAADTK